jgi:hypothetical protein
MCPSDFCSARYILVHLDYFNIEFSAISSESYFILHLSFIFYGNISKSRFMFSGPIIYYTSYILPLGSNLFLFAKFCIKSFSSKLHFFFI